MGPHRNAHLDPTRENPAREPRNRWLVVVAASLVVFMATLDASIVTVALPVLQQDFGVDTSAGQWVILAYLIPLIAITLSAGRWVDRVGTRAALAVTVIGFGVMSLLAGAAPTWATLLAARGAQGAFAGISFTLLPVVITGAVQPSVRGRAMAFATTVGPLGSVFGPVAGGVLTGAAGWRWIFWANVPIAVGIALIAYWRMPADGPLRGPAPGTLREVVLIGTATASGLVALTLAPLHGAAWLLPALVAPPLAWFWWRGVLSRPVREANRPRTVRVTQLALLTSSVATAGLMFLLPYFIQAELHHTPRMTGLLVLAFPAATAVLGPVAGVLSDRHGPRGVILAGAGTMLAGAALVLPLDATWSPADLVWRLAVAGAGMGLFYGPNMALTFTAAPPHLLGAVGASSSVIRQLGFAAGPAAVTAAWVGSGGESSQMVYGAAVAVLASAVVLAAAVSLSRAVSPDPKHNDQKQTQENSHV